MSLNDNTTIRIGKAGIPVILSHDNTNQAQWLEAVRTYAQANSSMALLTKKLCTSRALTEHDISPAGKIGKPEIKVKQEGKPATEEDEREAERKEAEHKTAVANSPLLDLSKLDDVERVLFTGMRVFVDENGDDEKA